MLHINNKWNDLSIEWDEDSIQAALATVLHRIEKETKSFSFSADMNAGKRSKGDGAKKKAMGMRRGESDIRIYLPAGKIWLIELKTKDGPVRKDQRDRHATLRSLGHDVMVLHCPTPLYAVEQVVMGLSSRLNRESSELMGFANIGGRI